MHFKLDGENMLCMLLASDSIKRGFTHLVYLESEPDVLDSDQEQVVSKVLLEIEECLQSPALLILYE